MRNGLTQNARQTLEARYLLKNEAGEVVETPEQLFYRVSRAVAAGEKKIADAGGVRRAENRFFELISSLTFLPNSPTLMNAGTDLGQLAACFVLPVGDSLREISIPFAMQP